MSGINSSYDSQPFVISNAIDSDTLDGKHASEFATASHTHSESEITNLTTDLAAKIAIPASSAQGDILIRDASGWTRLAAGTSGQLLKTQGAGANPVWETLQTSSFPSGVYGIMKIQSLAS